MDEYSRRWATNILKLIKLTYTVVDPHQLTLNSNRAYIVMSNHASLYDIPLIMLALPGSIRMMAKKELFRVPIWGRAMKHSEFIPIDRSHGRRALRDLKYAKKKLEDGIVIWIAPEGTRSRTGRLQPFKKGGFMLAKQANAIIIPVGIRGAGKILPPKTLDLHIKEHVEIHLGKPIDTTEYKVTDRDLLIQDVANSISKAANIEQPLQ
jgi:1-acyl-sn-glycerol-3-phosphate acyltransferase